MAARKQRPKLRPSALQHGVFSASAILPGEDPEEFEALFRSLQNEWQPSGITENAAVLALAQCLWRVHRLDIFVQAERVKARACPLNDTYNLIRIMAKHKDDKEECSKQIFLAADGEVYSYQPLDELGDLLEGSDIWKGLVDFEVFLKDEFDALGWSEKRIPWLRSALMRGTKQREFADLASRERFEKELALRDRLEGMIDRYIKRLMQLKVGKRTLGLEPPGSPPERFPPPKLVK